MARLKVVKPAAAETANGLQEMTSFGGKVDFKAKTRTVKVQAPPEAKTADDRLAWCNSCTRTGQLVLEMSAELSARKRVRLFLDWACLSDAPWWNRSWFSSLLREALKEVRLIDLLDEPERAWFESLGDEIAIYRGCEKGRERGMHWTTDINVAKGFAIGVRCRNRHPTLVSAVIPKQHVLALFLGRRETEIVVDYRRLRRLRIEELPLPKAEAA
jgi:hypothetical protein